MPESLPLVVDVDDLYCEEQIVEFLVPLKEAVPAFRVTAYSIPNKLGPVQELGRRYQWVTFAIHGWEHTPFESKLWTRESAEERLFRAKQMGYQPLFKPPNWLYDEELLIACREQDVVFAHHPEDTQFIPDLMTFPGPKEQRGSDQCVGLHTHIQKNPVTDWIGSHPGFRPEKLATASAFHTPFEHLVRVMG